MARLKAGGVRYERRALELDNDAIRVGDGRRVPLAALRRVAVTESKELEFSVDCGDDGALSKLVGNHAAQDAADNATDIEKGGEVT